MSASRRRFLKSAVAVGGVALGQRAGAWSSVPAGRAPSGSPAAAARPAAAAGQGGRALPTQAEVEGWYKDQRNWGRWGADDEVGAVNLITAEKRQAAAALVRNGRTVSTSRLFEPTQHFVRKNDRGAGAGSFIDYYGFIYHGQTITHIDALCHVWENTDGVWQGRDPDAAVDTHGARFGAITAWSNGIITRGVLLDVPRHRGEPHVTADRPVHGWELEEIAAAQGVEVGPGDALLVHSGREAFQRAGGAIGGGARPGLHASCAKFIRDRDIALLGWDMMDARPNDYGLAYPVHGVLTFYGVALLDNALLEPLADACAEEGRHEFMFMALPLNVKNGTGSPANPIAMF